MGCGCDFLWCPSARSCMTLAIVSTKEPFQRLINQGMILGEVSGTPLTPFPHFGRAFRGAEAGAGNTLWMPVCVPVPFCVPHRSGFCIALCWPGSVLLCYFDTVPLCY